MINQLHPLNKILSTIAAVFAAGIALLLLNAFQEALTQYSALIVPLASIAITILNAENQISDYEDNSL